MLYASERFTRSRSLSRTKGDTNFGDIAGEGGNLAHEGAGDELELVARRQEHGLDVGHQLSVHAGHLELVLEVADGAQTAHHDLAALIDHEIAQQAAETDITSTFGYLAASSVAIWSRSVDREHGPLVVAFGDGEDQPLEQAAGPAHQVFVTERHGVEGAGVHGGQSGHRGHAHLQASKRVRAQVARSVAVAAQTVPRAPQQLEVDGAGPRCPERLEAGGDATASASSAAGDST